MRPAFSKNIAGMSGNMIREILKLTQQPEVISFAGGMPPVDAFPVDALREISEMVFDKYKGGIFQYGTSEGFLPLREFIVTWMAEKGVKTELDEVLITSGAQQGIDLMAKAFLNSGDGVVIEKPTYLAAIQIFSLYGAEFVYGDADEQGFVPQSLRRAAGEKNCKLLYLVSNFQNPTGITLAGERRQELADLLSELEMVLIEDDPYGDLRYSGDNIKPVKSYDRENRAVYLGSFSKIISPGLRVGFAVGPKEIVGKLVVGKQLSDVHTSNLTQAIIYEFCAQGLIKPHIESLKLHYRKKCDLMLELMSVHFPPTATWARPEGGLFIWVQLPEGTVATELFKEAIKEKVVFIPGGSFFAGGGGANTLRLNFSNATEGQIEEGIIRLGKVMNKFMA